MRPAKACFARCAGNDNELRDVGLTGPEQQVTKIYYKQVVPRQ